MTAMRNNSRAVLAVLSFVGVLSCFSSSPAQAQAPSKPLGQPCNLLSDLVQADPRSPKPAVPPKLTPIDATTKTLILNSGLPCQETVTGDGPDKTKTPLEHRQRGFDFYSWLTFIALNSPADGSGIDQSKPNTKTKWEDRANFKQLLDVMLPGGAASEWTDKKQPPPGCKSQFDANHDMMVIEMIEETFNQPFKTGPLIDQQGSYALFDILMNRPMFDYIQKHKLYSKTDQLSAANSNLKIDFPAGVNPPEGQVEGGDPGGIIIKVSWKILESDQEKRKFHTVDALVSMPREDATTEPPCLRKTLGLVGFHVMHKTKSRLQWIWTSFEHVDNVPEKKEVDSRKLKPSYSFYNPRCNAATCKVNETPPWPWKPEPSLGLKFHSPFKSQIVRVTPLTDDTKKMNKQFQGILKGTVWENYMLLSTQWPSDFLCAKKEVSDPKPELAPNTDLEKEPDMNCAPAPTYLANSTLETYSQGDIPLASSSCMACHGNAASYQLAPPDANSRSKFFNQSDFTFMLEKAREKAGSSGGSQR
jgi:hypothetical protein